MGHYVRKRRLSKAVPGELFPVAADAFNNLRHALDQAICASALAMNPSVKLVGISFAFGEDEPAFKTNSRSTKNKIAPDILAIMSNAQPYNRGKTKFASITNTEV